MSEIDFYNQRIKRTWVVWVDNNNKYQVVVADGKTKKEIISSLPELTPNFTYVIAANKLEAIQQAQDMQLDALMVNALLQVVKNMTIGPPFDTLPGYGTQFGDEELKLAIAIARVLETLNLAKADTSQTTLASVLTALGEVTSPSRSQQVTATDLDIRNLNSNTDSVTAAQSGMWTVNLPSDMLSGDRLKVDANLSPGGTQEVTATDLDIRNLNSNTDSVTATPPTSLVEGDRIKTSAKKSEQGLHSSPNLSSTPVLVFPSNSSRQGISIYNGQLVSVFVGYASDINASKYALKVEPGKYFEMPFDYIGNIYSFLEGGTGIVQFVEFI
jgi:hypothetical protein